jgi:hypothetical protein
MPLLGSLRLLLPWIPAPRFRGDKLRGNDVLGGPGVRPRPDSASVQKDSA